MSGGAAYELNWDGSRCALVLDAGAVRLWSRQGKDLTDRFPGIAAASSQQLAPGLVLDGASS